MTNLTWPREPYKGLSYYNPEDELLFAGRESDIDDCVGFLAELRTRTLIVHGRTGCGKSSFLRAGLIPALESRVTDLSFCVVILMKIPFEFAARVTRLPASPKNYSDLPDAHGVLQRLSVQRKSIYWKCAVDAVI